MPSRIVHTAAAPTANPVVTPEFWDEACKHLSKRDRVMRKLIPQCGEGRQSQRARPHAKARTDSV